MSGGLYNQTVFSLQGDMRGREGEREREYVRLASIGQNCYREGEGRGRREGTGIGSALPLMEKQKISCTVADFFFLARSKSSLSIDARGDEVKRGVGDGKKLGSGARGWTLVVPLAPWPEGSASALSCAADSKSKSASHMVWPCGVYSLRTSTRGCRYQLSCRISFAAC
jgi:hypothetical protein